MNIKKPTLASSNPVNSFDKNKGKKMDNSWTEHKRSPCSFHDAVPELFTGLFF